MELFREIYKNEKGLLEFWGEDGRKYSESNIEELFKNSLIEGKKRHELINLKGLRGLGATTAVINYAKEYGYIVIVGLRSTANELKNKFEYNKIYSYNDYLIHQRGLNKNHSNDKLILDGVGIDKSFIEAFQDRIVTGFSPLQDTMIDFNENKKPIDYLEFEEKQLRKKIDKALSYDDGAMYVKLINAYEKIIDIMLKLRAAE